MKKVLGVFLTLALLTACEDDSLHVDLQGELNERASLTLTLEDGTEIEGFEHEYCTDLICFEKEPIDFSALTHTSIPRDATLLVNVDSSYTITSVGGSLFKTDGTEFYRDLNFTMVEEKVYSVDSLAEVEGSEVTLRVKVIFDGQGRTNFYFPLQLE